MEEVIVIAVCLVVDVLVLPAIFMVMWNHCIIKDIIVAPNVLPEISYGTAIIARLFTVCVHFSMSNATMGFDKEKNMNDNFDKVYHLLENKNNNNRNPASV